MSKPLNENSDPVIDEGPDSIVSRSLEELKSLTPDLRLRAAERLAEFGVRASRKTRERSLPDLLEFMRKDTEDARARCAIVRLLWETTWELQLTKKIAPELANLLDDDNEGVRVTAMQALEQFRPASVDCAPKIIQCLRNRPGDLAWHYAEGFFRFVANLRAFTDWRASGLVPPPGARKRKEVNAVLVAAALMEGLQVKHPKIRLISASVLGDLEEYAIPAIPALCEALKDKNSQVRQESARSLGKLGAFALRAVPALIEARHHPDPGLQAEADEAFKTIAPDKYGAILLDESYRDPASRQLPVKPVARYLGNRKCQVGDEPAFVIDEKDAKVLEALIELGAADKKMLVAKTGDKNPGRRLAHICATRSQLVAHIVLPKKKGLGGYSTTIKRA